MDDAENTSVSVQEGDLIVMGTDGLFDNLSKEQILKEVAHLEVGGLYWHDKMYCSVAS